MKKWEKLLSILQTCVQSGTVTTYGKLSKYLYPEKQTTQNQPLGAMLKAAAARGHCKWTNRVVKQDGEIVEINEAREQLIAEGIPLLPNDNVDLQRCPPVNIVQCMETGLNGIDKSIGKQVGSVDPPVKKFTVSDEIIVMWKDLQFPEVDSNKSFTWTGFDSAWTGNNQGAIAWMTGNHSGLVFEDVKCATFDDCIDHVNNITSKMHLLMIDQPTIVTNTTGRRPVEKAVAHEMGRAASGVQPADPELKPNMFGENAPIWSFLEKLKKRNFQESTEKSRNATSGFYYLETYPALGNLGLFSYDICPKYNPGRQQTFAPEDWQMLCCHIGQVGAALNIEGLQVWVEDMLRKPQPTKTDQDYLDAVLCMLFGYIWWRSGLEHSVAIGDNETGYMVIPCLRQGLRSTLEVDAAKHDVPVDKLFSEQISSGPIEGGSKEPTPTKEKKKGFNAWLTRVFQKLIG